MRRWSSTRRQFLGAATLVTAGTCLRSQLLFQVSAQATPPAHGSVIELERANILTETPAPSDPARTDPHQFFSETEPDIRYAGAALAPKLFRAQARGLREFSATVACLAAAYLLTKDEGYAHRAAEHLRAWLLAPATRMQPSFDLAGCAASTDKGTPAGIVDLVPLAELARAISFLTDSPAFTPEELDALHAWFAGAQQWMETSRTAFIARESKDHRASAALLISSALARFLRDDAVLGACRARFRKPTLRNQIRGDGVFPQEVASPNPYRNSLLNFDLLAGACQLLASSFDPLWSFELIDGIGLRAVAAYLYPSIEHPERWPFVADAHFFRDLPGRRPALLFAGRAYNRAEYVALWQQLPPGPPPEAVAESFPIRQPLLWTARAPHGL